VRYGLILLLLTAIPCCCQTSTTGQAETKGPCSPAVTGSNNRFTISCQGINDKLGAQLIDLLNRVAKNQIDADAIMAKLDGCLTSQEKIKETMGGWKLDPEAQKRLTEKLTPFAGTPFILTVNPDEVRFMFVLDDILEKAGWKWQPPTAGGTPPLFGPAMLGGKAGVTYSFGISIEVPQKRLEDLGQAADSLATYLNNEGIPAKGYRVYQPAEPTAVRIAIGKRE
jgi:hypothetical protein